MFVHVGKRMFGKCEVIPELLYVGTLFFHVDFVPLVPVGSYIVLGRSRGGGAVKVGLQWRSVLLTWLRVGAFGMMVTGIVMAVASALDPPAQRDLGLVETSAAIGGVSAAAFAFLMLWPRRKPRYGRACVLARLAKLTDREWAAMNVLYGRGVMDRGEEEALTLR